MLQGCGGEERPEVGERGYWLCAKLLQIYTWFKKAFEVVGEVVVLALFSDFGRPSLFMTLTCNLS